MIPSTSCHGCQELVSKANFPDGMQLVYRFQHGLDPKINHTISNMVKGCLDDNTIEEWIAAACCVEHVITYRAPASVPALPVTHPLPMGAPMEINASHQHVPLGSLICHHCGEAGHIQCHCPCQYNIWFMTIDEHEDLFAEITAMHNATSIAAIAVPDDVNVVSGPPGGPTADSSGDTPEQGF
ncbi:hypothetical protein DXG01_001946 [Tephrocybe rancida]|nr:hypothetical protein DXG01_001946 [Tephrocybe rancida]